MPTKLPSQTQAEQAAQSAHNALRAAISEVETALDQVRAALDLPPRDRWVERAFANPESRAKLASILREACMDARQDHFTHRRGPFGR